MSTSRPLFTGTTTVNLGTTPSSSGKFTLFMPDRCTTMLVHQAAGPYPGKGSLSDEAEMDGITVSTVFTGRGTVQCHWRSSGAVVGNFRFNWLAT